MPTSPVEYLRASALLKEHGEVRSQPVSDWTGEIPLPTDVEDFYRQGGPVEINVKGSGNPIFFPSLANLWKLQAGYRWNG